MNLLFKERREVAPLKDSNSAYNPKRRPEEGRCLTWLGEAIMAGTEPLVRKYSKGKNMYADFLYTS